MNELPQVLQKEIWEYVRGDRAHWRKVFREGLFANWRFRSSKSLTTVTVPRLCSDQIFAFRRVLITADDDYWKRVIGEVDARLDQKFQTFLRRHYLKQTRKPKPKRSPPKIKFAPRQQKPPRR